MFWLVPVAALVFVSVLFVASLDGWSAWHGPASLAYLVAALLSGSLLMMLSYIPVAIVLEIMARRAP